MARLQLPAALAAVALVAVVAACGGPTVDLEDRLILLEDLPHGWAREPE